ncbi:unnamed protein product [Caenorhabditis auriculariae]|uniref:G-protein coupled receptors family 1 profile domain-containing protein n=1 Tax=Caenorhabditis auriculariae TaxID=2777116 RepID=A0A8S1GPJ0_9PELO|nr:unnamed protein product [Caenorhabditis auriculariae]
MIVEVPERIFVENIEIFILLIVVAVAVLLNALVFAQIVSTTKTPTVRTNFLTGPYHKNSFQLFKLNLCISDFFILLIYALGKIVWLTTFEWKLGNSGCKLYKFFSSFSFYANSNIIVAIALDRLKVVYTTQIQGATSVRRVRCMIFGCWLFAFLCSFPQFFIWRTMPVGSTWEQCVTIFAVANYHNATTELLERSAIFYEIGHQFTVFWLPLMTILISYILIVLKLLHYSLRAREKIKIARFSDSEERPLTNSFDVFGKRVKRKSRWENFLQLNMIKKQRDTPRPVSGITLHRTKSWPTWRSQLGSRVFRSACLIVVTHITLWLPYNTISATRFIDQEFYQRVMENGGNFLEDLIVVNSLLNPLLYAQRRCRK